MSFVPGTHFYRQKTKYTKLAPKPVPTTTTEGFSIPAAAGVVDEKGSEYILVHTGPRELDGHPLGGCGSGFSSQLYYPFGKGPDLIRCLK